MDIKPTRTFELKFKDPKLKDQTYYSIYMSSTQMNIQRLQ